MARCYRSRGKDQRWMHKSEAVVLFGWWFRVAAWLSHCCYPIAWAPFIGSFQARETCGGSADSASRDVCATRLFKLQHPDAKLYVNCDYPPSDLWAFEPSIGVGVGCLWPRFWLSCLFSFCWPNYSFVFTCSHCKGWLCGSSWTRRLDLFAMNCGFQTLRCNFVHRSG